MKTLERKRKLYLAKQISNLKEDIKNNDYSQLCKLINLYDFIEYGKNIYYETDENKIDQLINDVDITNEKDVIAIINSDSFIALG